MSKSVNGDPEIDAKLNGLNDLINILINSKNLKNIDIKLARRLAKTMKKSAAELDDYVMVRMEQKLGGHIGATKKK